MVPEGCQGGSIFSRILHTRMSVLAQTFRISRKTRLKKTKNENEKLEIHRPPFGDMDSYDPSGASYACAVVQRQIRFHSAAVYSSIP